MASTHYTSHDAPSHPHLFDFDQYIDTSVYDWLDDSFEDSNYASNLDCPWPTPPIQCSDGAYFDIDLMSIVSGSTTPSPTRSTRSGKEGESARPHYATEKKYRQRLNDKFKALQTCLTDVERPLCSELAQEKSKFLEALQSGRNGRSVKQRKSMVLALALEYVRLLESKHKQTSTEIESCQQLLFRSATQLANALNDETGEYSR